MHRITTTLADAAPAAMLVALTAAFLPGQQPDPAPAQVGASPQEQEQEETGKEAREQQEPEEGEDEVVVITATRERSRPHDLPYDTATVGGEEVVRERMLQDALDRVPGVKMQRTSYFQVSPYLRGLTGYHTLLMVDGIRLNTSILRAGPNEYWGTVDGYSLDRMELVMGPGAVLYGSDAVGGAVNAITRRRRDYEDDHDVDVRIASRYASAEGSIIGRTEVSGQSGGRFGYLLGVTGGFFNDLDAGGGFGRQPHTSYHNGFADAHLDFFIDDHWSLGLLAQGALVDDVRRTHKTMNGVSFHGTTTGSDRRRKFDWERELTALFLRGEDLDGFADSVEARVSLQRLEELQDRIRSSGERTIKGFDLYQLGAALELVSETDLGRFTYGFDYYRDEVDSFRDEFDGMGNLTEEGIQGPVGDDASYDLFGIFVQDQVDLGRAWELVLGTRFTYAAAEADRVEDPETGNPISVEDDWIDLVGSARLLWKASETARLWGGVSQGFRAPNLSDLTRLDSARSNEMEVPSPGLDPERFITFDLGGRVRTEDLEAEVTVFHTILDDVIIRQPTGMMIGMESVVTKRNGGDGHVQGVSARAEYDLDPHWGVFGTFSWIDGRQETFPTSAPVRKEEVISRLPPVQGSLGVRWQTVDGDLRISLEAVMVDDQDRLSTRDRGDTQRIPPGGTPGFTVYNLDTTYRLDRRSHVFLALENLTDKNYRIHGSGLQEPGFNAVVGFDLTF